MNHQDGSCADFYAHGFDQLYTIKTLINLTKNTCKDMEFKGLYYGLDNSNIVSLSTERNDYINMLEIISDKISDFMGTYLALEKSIATVKHPQLQQKDNSSVFRK